MCWVKGDYSPTPSNYLILQILSFSAPLTTSDSLYGSRYGCTNLAEMENQEDALSCSITRAEYARLGGSTILTPSESQTNRL